MRVKNFSEVSKHFIKTAEEVLRDHVPTIITTGSKSVVMMSLEDFNSYEETFYLTKNPANYKRLLQSVKDIKNHQYKTHSLIDEKTD